jgi:hypothetical protein
MASVDSPNDPIDSCIERSKACTCMSNPASQAGFLFAFAYGIAGAIQWLAHAIVNLSD